MRTKKMSELEARYGGEYRYGLNDKFIPKNDSSPTYSPATKREIKRLKKEEIEYAESMSGEVKTYHISELEGDK